MQTLDPGTGTSVLLSQPSPPVSARALKKISALLAGIDEVLEAHLPAVLTIGAGGAPAPVLVVVVCNAAAVAPLRERIDPALTRALGARKRPALWLVTREHALLETVRATDCVVGWRD